MKTHDVPTRTHSAPVGADQLLPERTPQDTYRMRGKVPEPAHCPDCKAVYHKGKWQWLEAPEAARSVVCPACHRIRDKYPAGFVTLRGPRLPVLHDELMNQIRNEEQAARTEHPLERVMEIDDGNVWEWLVTTTDIHLARRIGEAVQRAHQGKLTIRYNPDEHLVRIDWESPA